MRLVHMSLLALASIALLGAAEERGVVTFGGLPLPGATVTASQGEKKLVTSTDAQGKYSLDLADGSWIIKIEMQLFAPVSRTVAVAAGAPVENWEMTALPMSEIHAAATVVNTPPPNLSISAPPAAAAEKKPAKNEAAPSPAAPSPEPNPDTSQDASDNFLINGSQNNGAASPFAQSAAFGNNRRNLRGLYNGMIGMLLDNSTLDAQNFSLTGQRTPKPYYDHLQGVATFGGPLRIPHLINNGPMFFVAYQWTRQNNSLTQTGLMPTAAERMGDFSALSTPILDPLNHNAPFAGNIIPGARLSPQALALLNLFPLPNFSSSVGNYNYQIPTLGSTHQDAMQVRMNKLVNSKNQLSGQFAFQNSRRTTPNLFDYLDTNDILGQRANLTWRNTIAPRLFGTLTIDFSRYSTTLRPFFENRENVSGLAGIAGNDQAPEYWGPPSLAFSDGISTLSDGNPMVNHNQTGAVGYSLFWSRGRHNITVGGDVKRQQFNYLTEQNPRGSFNFTGAAAGDGFADFMLGVPDTSSIAFGNADKYFRNGLYDAYITDDWRLSPELTLNLGARWEYNAPITELYGRLVNLDVAPGFSAVAPVVANDPVGSLTGQRYSDSLVNPDKHAIQPRIAIAWRPLSGSSLVVRSGYGVYYDTSVYPNIALQMAQQAPLSKSLSVANSAADPLTLANPFVASPTITPNTFAVDPNVRPGYSQNWNLSLQRDLPGGLVMIASYLGIKGTHNVQQFLPNTYPEGAVNPCSACASGYIYMTSNGNSSYESGQFQLRRRLHSGFTATLQYTYSKAIDDAALGGAGSPTSGGQTAAVIAQNWLDLSAERGLSPFDQRHVLKAQLQYTSGMGIHGGTLVGGWRGALLKEWTLLSSVTVASGMPLTPIYPSAVQGTGVTGPVRPDYTGANVYAAPSGLFLNPAAYTAPALGEWGDAGRDSIIGPRQFTLNASLGRTFRMTDRLNLDLRVDATNLLNHVTFPSWNTTVSPLFGLPNPANPMRSLQTTLRVRF
ncbi:MAG TPA: carboxypeptidase regulatory-like domain-containing protein [Bryobacteraceae bacterium]|nr:carboxypeptidase regulatory-like domain-containing protein [Bryobacteraceae bacterium]